MVRKSQKILPVFVSCLQVMPLQLEEREVDTSFDEFLLSLCRSQKRKTADTMTRFCRGNLQKGIGEALENRDTRKSEKADDLLPTAKKPAAI